MFLITKIEIEKEKISTKNEPQVIPLCPNLFTVWYLMANLILFFKIVLC